MRNVFVVIVLVLSIFQSFFGQEKGSRDNQISVIGSVELKEIADQASFTFSIKGVGSSLHNAVDDASNKVFSLTRKLLQIGLSEKNISTSQFFSGENYGDKAFLSSSRDFKAELVTMITIDSLKLLDSVLYMISDDHVESLSDISFHLKDELGLRRRARIAAATKAKEKAQDITGALGASLGSVVQVEELEPTNISNQVYIRGGRSGEAKLEIVDEVRGSGFFAQTISVVSQVRVTFGIK